MTIEAIYALFLKGGSVRIDSRKVEAGDLFFTLKGERFNGNDFASEVLDRSPTLIVMDEDRGLDDSRVVVVEDALTCLQDLARHHRMQLKIPVIGLTGSNGKTTSKELFRAVLERKFKVCATEGNLNNHIGVPLSLLNISLDDEVAIIEMGANAQKEIEFLCSMSMPDIGYITNFGLAHLEGFGGPEGVVKGKSELYDYLRKNDKKALVFSDEPRQIEKSEGIERIFFGSQEPMPYRFSMASELPLFSLNYDGHIVQTQLSGAYNLSNVAAAFRLGLYLGVPEEDIKAGLSAYSPNNNRSQRQKGKQNELIIDCYNANPSSMEVALKSLARHGGEKMAILGDMFEMGEYEEKEHRRIGSLAIELGIEEVILVGTAFSAYGPSACTLLPHTEALLEHLRNHPPKDKLILLKGSRGMTLEKAIELL